jgi:Tfp pilus assembly protein PilE
MVDIKEKGMTLIELIFIIIVLAVIIFSALTCHQSFVDLKEAVYDCKCKEKPGNNHE